jgi:hypothetical protein
VEAARPGNFIIETRPVGVAARGPNRQAGDEWHENGEGRCRFPDTDCSKCGPVEPNHVGWSGDFR